MKFNISQTIYWIIVILLLLNNLNLFFDMFKYYVQIIDIQEIAISLLNCSYFKCQKLVNI